ncbi:MAG: hypothetical protein N3B14_06735 [Thermoleophilia bacterium]|nr:hypothetical protein [Thermoleophilia bacterium]
MKKIKEASRRHPRVLVAIGLVAGVLVLCVAAVALAASVTPTSHPGNTPDTYDLKIDPPNSGSYAIPGHPGKYVQVTFSADKKWVDFSSDVPVTEVAVKGGPNYYEYDYGSSGVSSDSGLRAPDNEGGQQPQISHVSFNFGSPGTTTTTTTQETTTTTEEETTTTTEEETTTTTEEETTTTVGGETTVPTQPQTTVTTAPPVTGGETTVPQTTSTAPPVTGGETTTPPASQVQAGGGGTAGMGGGMWALIVLAASLGIGLTASTLKARLGTRQ